VTKIVIGGVVVVIAALLYTMQNSSTEKEETTVSQNVKKNETDSSQKSTKITTTKVANPQTKIEAITKLEALQTCDISNTCPEDNSDPRASDFLRANMMVNEINRLSDFNNDPEVISKIQELLSYPDGNVQEALLKILAISDPEMSNIDPLLGALNKSFDAKNSQLILKELERYPDAFSQYETIFEQVLKTGSFGASQELSKSLAPFLTDENREVYEAVLKELNPNSKKAKNLESILFEFSMQQNGG
jgi:hypothetical protein